MSEEREPPTSGVSDSTARLLLLSCLTSIRPLVLQVDMEILPGLPLLLPTLMVNHHAQGQHCMNVGAGPWHPGSLYAGLHHPLVGVSLILDPRGDATPLQQVLRQARSWRPNLFLYRTDRPYPRKTSSTRTASGRGRSRTPCGQIAPPGSRRRMGPDRSFVG